MNKIWNTVRMFLWLTLLTGLLYPLLITGIAQLTMKHRADGDFITTKDKVVGAKLIAQKFESDRYFWPRPSSIDYNPLPSGGSNLGPTSAVLKKTVQERREKLAKAHGTSGQKIPAELLFSSGSGLDPHIQLSTAHFQIDRVAKARGMKSEDLRNLIHEHATHRSLGFLGVPCVNVLVLNMALDEIPEQNEHYTQTSSRIGNLTRRRPEFEPGFAGAEAAQPK